MPVSKLYVEGALDEQLLRPLFAGSPVVEKRGGKYGLQGIVLKERAETAGRPNSPTALFLRDRDFDFQPVADAGESPIPMHTRRGEHVGYRWRRHCIESYLLEPTLVAAVYERPVTDVEAALTTAGEGLAVYQAARWTIGQARTQLPPARHLETQPEAAASEFILPPDVGEAACWTWVVSSTTEFLAPVREAFAEESLRHAFDGYRQRFRGLGWVDVLLWYSGKDLMASLAPGLSGGTAMEMRERLRNWVIGHTTETSAILTEWADLLRLLRA
jgi:hypothetical protein